MAQLAELAVPVVSTGAGFQRNLAGGQLREILQHPLTSEGLADYHTPAPVDPVQLEDLLCDIQTDSCNLHAWTLCVAKYKLRRRPGSQRGRCSVFASGMIQRVRLDGSG